jgi:hypothetical protein
MMIGYNPHILINKKFGFFREAMTFFSPAESAGENICPVKMKNIYPGSVFVFVCLWLK